MSSKQVLKGLIPWLLYVVLTIPDGGRTAEIAALAALTWAVASLVRDLLRRRSAKILDVCAVGLFGTFAIVGNVDGQGRGLATAVLAAVMLVSAAVGPFTEQYAREHVPAAYWTSPLFRSVQRDLSIRWGVAMVVVAIGYLAADDLAAVEASQFATFALAWLLPAAAVALALRTTSTNPTPRSGRGLFRSGTS